MDGEYIWTYSNINDAMFYGNLTHDMFYTVRLTVKDQSGNSDYFERSLKVIAN
jgi:hypothetical protein